MAETPCGHTHLIFEDAERKRRGGESFGSIPEGENLWWGDKDADHIKNRGYVIGLWNRVTGDRWRIDYDPVKGLHLNQDNKNHEEKTMYPIQSFSPLLRCMEIMVALTDRNVDKIPPDIQGRLGNVKWYGRFWA
jgi:hypothetical protein